MRRDYFNMIINLFKESQSERSDLETGTGKVCRICLSEVNTINRQVKFCYECIYTIRRMRMSNKLSQQDIDTLYYITANGERLGIDPETFPQYLKERRKDTDVAKQLILEEL